MAVGAPYRPRRSPAPAPAGGAASLRRAVGTFREPNAWTVGLLLATGVVIIARHPIAHALGTEVDSAQIAVHAPAGVVGAAALTPTVPALSAGVAVPSHAPVDPFRPLVSMTGRLLAAAPLATKTSASAPKPAATAAGAASTTSACTGAVHRVVGGDTLWTLAARATRSADTGRVTLAWHRLYAANKPALGTNPSLIHVGQRLCIPTDI